MTTGVPGSPAPVRLAPVMTNSKRKALVAPDCTGEGVGGVRAGARSLPSDKNAIVENGVQQRLAVAGMAPGDGCCADGWLACGRGGRYFAPPTMIGRFGMTGIGAGSGMR